MSVRELEPKTVWNHFADLNAVPRASKKEEEVIAFMVNFGKSLGLETFTDEVGNVFIKKPGSKGFEDKPIVVMQGHLDMVHQKNADVDFDFATQGIKMKVEEDWVKAEGTTLGADNGMGVAYIMAILSSNDIDHPPLEALFTIDEETGMTGALGLKGGLLDGRIMINLDTEDDDEITIGCAGGVDVTASRNSETEATPSEMTSFKLTLNGLNGGHSGMDIIKGLGNANKLMNRMLWKMREAHGLRIHSINGGGLRNAIPRESFSEVAIPKVNLEDWKAEFMSRAETIKAEYASNDADLNISLEEISSPDSVITVSLQDGVLASIYAAFNGIYRMSPDIPDLVQTSNNVAKVTVNNEMCEVLCLTRSSLDSEKFDLANALAGAFEPAGFDLSLDGSYPGWTPAPKSDLVEMMRKLYVEMFEEQPNVMACHAGLECGILSTNYPGMDMISFGPNIRGAHSPDEKCQISSVKKSWDYLLEGLKRI
ncbi:MAG: aminoacyl-histidine dipeptidase [Flavobacteriales bacterium]